MKTLKTAVFVIWLGLLLAACVPLTTPSPSIPTVLPSPEQTQIVGAVQFSYIFMSYEDMVAEADAIWLGKVANISPTRWNQDSGEFWEGGLQVHTIDIEVLQPIVENIQLDDTVRVTALGKSPLDGPADHDLSVGDEIVVFARATELVWRGGRQPVVYLLGYPANAYLKRSSPNLYSSALRAQAIGLNDLIAEIETIRAANPPRTAMPVVAPTSAPSLYTSEVEKLLLTSHTRWQTLQVEATTRWFLPGGSGAQVLSSSVQIQQLANVRVQAQQWDVNGTLMLDWVWLSNSEQIISQDNLNQTTHISQFPYPVNSLRKWQPPSLEAEAAPYRHPMAMLMQSQLGPYLYPVELAQSSKLTPLGEEMLINRLTEAVLWERFDPNSGQVTQRATYWVDWQTGIVLKAQTYTGEGFTQLTEETIITQIQVDEPLPPEIFRQPAP